MGPKFIVQVLLNVIITMVLIFAIKKFSIKYNVPGLKTVSEGI